MEYNRTEEKNSERKKTATNIYFEGNHTAHQPRREEKNIIWIEMILNNAIRLILAYYHNYWLSMALSSISVSFFLCLSLCFFLPLSSSSLVLLQQPQPTTIDKRKEKRLMRFKYWMRLRRRPTKKLSRHKRIRKNEKPKLEKGGSQTN